MKTIEEYTEEASMMNGEAADIVKTILEEVYPEFQRTIDDRCTPTVNSCDECEFWTMHKPSGTCSQKIGDGSTIIQPTTFCDYSCSTFSSK